MLTPYSSSGIFFIVLLQKWKMFQKIQSRELHPKKSYLIVYYSCENDFLQETFEECDSFITIDLSSHKHFQVKPCLEPFYPIQEIFKADLRWAEQLKFHFIREVIRFKGILHLKEHFTNRWGFPRSVDIILNLFFEEFEVFKVQSFNFLERQQQCGNTEFLDVLFFSDDNIRQTAIGAGE